MRIPTTRDVASAVRTFSSRERAVFFGLLGIFLASMAGIASLANQRLMVEVPAAGGNLTEGIIGVPRFINPLLANSDADRDLTALVYSGLLRAGKDGTFIPDLAQQVIASPDGLSYTFTLRPDLRWQDGEPLTSDDVSFTIEKAQDPILKSPRRAAWEGVKVIATDPRTLVLTLKQPYPSFLENATMGILPKHIWKSVDAETFPFSSANTQPVGSGPYRITGEKTNGSGAPVSVSLAPFDGFALGAPKISSLDLRFYADETELTRAYLRGEVESMSAVSPETVATLVARGARVEQATLPRVFAVFFNQNRNHVFASQAVRAALDRAISKDALVRDVLKGYGEPLAGPLAGTTLSVRAGDLASAKQMLARDGWKLDPKLGVLVKKSKKTTEILRFTLVTANAPELKAAAAEAAAAWKALGADVQVQAYETSDLLENTIRPRAYDALLFGEIVGRDQDLFPFWHSSQRNDPGLNIALYTNAKVDKLLEQARTTQDAEKRQSLAEKAEQAIVADTPAVFLYAPKFLYVLPARVRGVALDSIVADSDRFTHINQWYIETEHLWKIFASQ